jgi:hypothetical protein
MSSESTQSEKPTRRTLMVLASTGSVVIVVPWPNRMSA